MPVNILYGQDALTVFSRDVKKLSDIAARTLGPVCGNVFIPRKNGSVTVATDISAVIENAGSNGFGPGWLALSSLAKKMEQSVGDGAATAILLASEIFLGSRRLLVSGCNVKDLTAGMRQAMDAVLSGIENLSRPCSGEQDILHVATTAAGGDSWIGHDIMAALSHGSGTVLVEPSHQVESYIDVVEGFQFDRGYASSSFLSGSGDTSITLENCLVLSSDGKIETIDQTMAIANTAIREKRPVLVVAGGFSSEALVFFLANRDRFQVLCVMAPGYGQLRSDMLYDIALATGGRVVSEGAGRLLEKVELDDFGRAGRVVVDSMATTIFDGGGDLEKIQLHVSDLKRQFERTVNSRDREVLERRLAMLSGGILIMRVGAATGLEVEERLLRTRRALRAAQTAKNGGIVPGGGAALLLASDNIQNIVFDRDDARFGAELVRRAILRPAEKIATNADYNGEAVVSKMLEMRCGFNVVTGVYGDMFSFGIVDPKDVVCVALVLAVDTACLLMQTGALITKSSLGV